MSRFALPHQLVGLLVRHLELGNNFVLFQMERRQRDHFIPIRMNRNSHSLTTSITDILKLRHLLAKHQDIPLMLDIRLNSIPDTGRDSILRSLDNSLSLYNNHQ